MLLNILGVECSDFRITRVCVAECWLTRMSGEGEKVVDIGARTQGPRTDSKCSTSAGWDGVISWRRLGGSYDKLIVEKKEARGD